MGKDRLRAVPLVGPQSVVESGNHYALVVGSRIERGDIFVAKRCHVVSLVAVERQFHHAVLHTYI